MSARIIPGDCLEALRELPDGSVDAIVTDPPYGLEFMGKEWDGADGFRRSLNPADAGRENVFGRASRRGPEYRAGTLFQEWSTAWATEALRVLKPGGHMLAFGGTRTWHRLAVAVEDAEFEIRDSIAWLYGSGFPKSRDVSKDIDRMAGVEREVVGAGPYANRGRRTDNRVYGEATPSDAEVITAPATEAARQWSGWGTALKPAHEPIVVARKPLTGTVAANVLEHGTGALNIDGCRIGTEERTNNAGGASSLQRVSRVTHGYRPTVGEWTNEATTVSGRWPANVVLDVDQAAALDDQSGTVASTGKPGRPAKPGRGTTGGYGGGLGLNTQGPLYSDTGGASRFFYCAKAPKKERPVVDGVAHPTVKPLSLMRWLVRLVTPPGGTVLDPFAGSGTTIEAALLEGFNVIGIEREADYLPLIQARIDRTETAA